MVRTLKLWWRALNIIPKVSREEWERYDPITKWLVAGRSAVLVMTFTSATIGGLFAALHGKFRWDLYLLTTLGLVLAHAASNFFNDFFDYKLGLDEENYFRAKYGPQPLVAGLLDERGVLKYGIVTMVLAAAIGLYLTYIRGWVVVLLALAGFVSIMGYSFSKRIGLGEPLVVVVWGPLMVAGTYFVITGQWSWDVFYAGLVYALGPTSVLFGKHIDKYEDDLARGVRTLPIILGKERARNVAKILMIGMYIGVLLLVLLRILPFTTLVVVFAVDKLSLAMRAFSMEKPESPPEGYPPEAWPLWYAAFAFVHNRKFGLLFILGLFLGLFLRVPLPGIG